MAECVDGLLHETTRPSRIAPLALEIAEGMVAPNLTNALGESTQLAADKIASASGISASVVRRLWKYPNKNGGPDRRFADNRQLPICLYKSIHLTSPTCLDELSQVSKAELTRQSAGALRALGATNGGEEGKLALAQL